MTDPATIARILKERDEWRELAEEGEDRANRWRLCAFMFAVIFTLAMVAMGYAR